MLGLKDGEFRELMDRNGMDGNKRCYRVVFRGVGSEILVIWDVRGTNDTRHL